MSDYGIDKERLEELSTQEIMRILKEETDDYTPEAISIFREILASRGYSDDGSALRRPSGGSSGTGGSTVLVSGDAVRHPSDAIRVLNGVLAGVLNGSIQPQVAKAAAKVVMAILHAVEQEYMTGSREES